MKTNQNEHLSALLDDEAGEFERRRLLDELRVNTALGETLSRYSLMGEAIRSQQKTVVADDDFLAGIQAQLESEPEYNEVVISGGTDNKAVAVTTTQDVSNFARQSASPQPWYRQGRVGYALAASIALAALAGILITQNNDSDPVQGDAVLAETGSGSPVPTIDMIATTASSDPTEISENGSMRQVTDVILSPERHMAMANTADPGNQAAETLKQYVTFHMQYRSSNGIAPSIQAISYAK